MGKGSEEKKERYYEEVCSRNFVTSFAEYNKDKVHVDITTSLVVNHVNLGVSCLFELYLCLRVLLGYRSRKYLNIRRVWITIECLCINGKLS